MRKCSLREKLKTLVIEEIEDEPVAKITCSMPFLNTTQVLKNAPNGGAPSKLSIGGRLVDKSQRFCTIGQTLSMLN